jgi:bifunctional DNA-binding transcriptional regulator/antitoxin component of YhaV-PrlF toxin-antitoxin module
MKEDSIITITKQWQIYVPLWVRKKLDMDMPSTAEISVKNGAIIIQPRQSKFLSLKGSVKSKKGKKIDMDLLRDAIEYCDEDRL